MSVIAQFPAFAFNVMVLGMDGVALVKAAIDTIAPGDEQFSRSSPPSQLPQIFYLLSGMW